MSGIGMHNFSTDNKSIWKPDLAICPYCGDEECDADWVSVGVGLVQCGPYHCMNCGAIEIGSADSSVELSEKEVETGWYRPGRFLELFPDKAWQIQLAHVVDDGPDFELVGFTLRGPAP